MSKKKGMLLYSLAVGIIFFIFYSNSGYINQEENISYMVVMNKLIKQITGAIPFETIKGNMHGAVYPIFLAYCAKLFHIDSAQLLCSYVQGAALAVMLGAYPLLMQRLTQKWWIGVLSPFLVGILSYDYLVRDATYSYWGGGVTALCALPLLCLLMKRMDQNNRRIVTVLLILMTVGNLIRQHSALPVLCGLLLYWIIRAVRRREDRKACIGGILLSCALFFLAEPALHFGYDACSGKLNIDNVEKPWHAVWCGLGYSENQYGFEWNDSAAAGYVASIDPEVEYCSEEYFEILKDRVFEVLRKDPGFVIKTYWRKFMDSILLGGRIYGKICAVLGVLWLLSLLLRRKQSILVLQGIGAAVLIICAGAAQGVIGWPAGRYLYSSFAGYIFLALILASGILLNLVERKENTNE